MFGLGLAMIGFGMAGIGGLGAYYLINAKNRAVSSIKVDKINGAIDRMEQFIRSYEAMETAKEKEIEEFQEEVEESNVINIEDVFSEYEREGKDVR